MKSRKFFIGLFLLIAIILAACSPKAAPTEVMSEKEKTSANSTEMMDDNDDSMMEDKSEDLASGVMMEAKDDEMMATATSDDSMHQSDSMMGNEGETMVEDKSDEMSSDSMTVPDWQKAVLTHAHTGETFTIADLKGKVVLVETMAIWCSNCFKQQNQVKALHEMIGERDDFVSLGVDIDPNENAEALKAYTDKNGFDWLYIVAPAEVSRELGQRYGDQFLNPPSTPMLIIDRHGEVHLLPFGIKTADSLLEALQPFLDGEM